MAQLVTQQEDETKQETTSEAVPAPV
ncbi:MAG: hypothetical protein QOH93_2606, partial [Chloroflexia bacterium]|nr:hypothetical protein [Chloroflexia bacterium]